MTFKATSFRGMWVIQDIFEGNIDYQEYESRGVTDIIKSTENYLETDYPAFQTTVNRTLDKLEGTDINLHVLTHCFHDKNNAIKYDQSQADFIGEQSAKALNDFPELRGISFDDYYYYTGYYDSSPNAQETQEQQLETFAQTVQTAMHDANSDSQLSSGLNVLDVNGCKISRVSPYFDFIIPMVYRYSNTHPQFVKDTLTSVKQHSSDTPVVAGLLSFHTESDYDHLWSVRTMTEDMQTSLKQDCGYSLFIYPFLSQPQTFPKTGSTCNIRFGRILERLIGKGCVRLRCSSTPKKQASPNFLPENIADCTNTTKDTYGFLKYTGTETITTDTDRFVRGDRSLKCVVTGDYYEGVMWSLYGLITGEPVTWSGQIWVEEGLNLYGQMNKGADASQPILLVGDGDWQDFVAHYTPTTYQDPLVDNWCVMKFATSGHPGMEKSFNLGEMQLEIGNSVTVWDVGK